MVLKQNIGHALGRASFPEKMIARIRSGCECSLYASLYRFRVDGWCQSVPSGTQQFDPFGLRSKSDARHTMEERFLLNSAGVGDDRPCVSLKHHHIQITQRLDGLNPRRLK